LRALAGKKVIGASAGSHHTAVWTGAGELFTFGAGNYGRLGHGGEHQHELVPRLVKTLVGKKVVAASAGIEHTAVCTDDGELFTFGKGGYGQLGHGGTQGELVPRLVETLAGKMVIGAATGTDHTVAWTDEGELFAFGHEHSGKLGHGREQHELLPRLIEALAGKKVIGASAGTYHTVVWTEEREIFTFGHGGSGQLGHGGEQNEFVPRLVEALAAV